MKMPDVEAAVRTAAAGMGINVCGATMNYARWARVWYWRPSVAHERPWDTMETDMDLDEQATFTAVTTAMRLSK